MFLYFFECVFSSRLRRYKNGRPYAIHRVNMCIVSILSFLDQSRGACAQNASTTRCTSKAKAKHKNKIASKLRDIQPSRSYKQKQLMIPILLRGFAIRMTGEATEMTKRCRNRWCTCKGKVNQCKNR